jgi:hypothetical protein
MKLFLGTTKLLVPILVSDKKAAIPTTAAALSDYLAHVNMQDVGNSVKQIFLLLHAQNQLTIPVDIRTQMLAIIEQPLQGICQALNKHCTIHASDLTSNKLAIATLASTIQLEIALGYKIIIEELHSNRAKSNNKGLLQEAMLAVVHYYQLALLSSYQLYQGPMPKIWQELHCIYQLAVAKKYNKVIQAYKQTLLMAASNPYQWRANDQLLIHKAMGLWSNVADLLPYKSGEEKKSSFFIVHLDQDCMPMPAALNTINPSNLSLLLDLKRVVNEICPISAEINKDEIGAKLANENHDGYALGATTINRLLKNWQKPITRTNKRYHVNGNMHLAVGLYAVHYYLNDEHALHNANEQSAATASNTLPTFDAFADETNSNEAVVPLYQAELDDISPTGACLLLDKHSPAPLEAGEILIMRPTHSKERGHWNIAVVRWLKYDLQQRLRIGIQIIGPYGLAAAVQVVKNNTPSGYFLHSVLLPPIAETQTPATILTPTVPFKSGKQCLFYTNDPKHLIAATLNDEVDATSNYRQFTYQAQEPIDFSLQTSKPTASHNNSSSIAETSSSATPASKLTPSNEATAKPSSSQNLEDLL